MSIETPITDFPIIDPVVGDELMAANDTNGDAGAVTPEKLAAYVINQIPVMPVMLKASQITGAEVGVSFLEGITTNIEFNADAYDTLGAADSANDRLVIPEAGFYILFGSFTVVTYDGGDNDNQHVIAQLRINGSVQGGTTYESRRNDYDDLDPRSNYSIVMAALNPNDAITMTSTQDSGDNTKSYVSSITAIKVA